MNLPKEIGRKYKPFDWWGWIMSILGLVLMCHFGGIGWIFGTDRNIWALIAVFFIFWDYAVRVGYGRIYKFVYYDTILHNMYELKVDDEVKSQFFVCALNEEELDLYMELHYPELEYKMVRETHVESFIKRNHFQ